MKFGIALALFAAFTAGLAANVVVVQQPAVPSLGLVDRFLAPEQAPLVSYRAYRRLIASTRGGKMQAALEAWTSLDPKKGFTFQITSQEGSGTIRNKVLLAALEAEAKAVGGTDAGGMALTRENYEFLDVSDTDNLTKVGIRPWRKHAMLLNGAVYLASDTADLIRIEGEPSQRPSFWTRHVKIVREYARVGGVRVPVAMHSTADVLVVGSSMFSMTYRYTEINGVAVN
jgi:hypothetical protein